MHICVIDLNGQFGPLNSLLDLVPPLTAEGFTFSFVVPASVHDEVSARLAGFAVEVVDGRSTWRREAGIASAVRALARSTGGIDVIHANSTSAARGAILAGLVTRRPVLIHLRNSKLTDRERQFLRIAHRMPVRSQMVAVSDAAADVAGPVARNCPLIPNPVFAGPRRDDCAAATPPVVGVVANMQLTKGFDVFVDVAHLLSGSGIHFQVFGSVGLEPVTSSYVREQRDRISALGLSESITFRGIVPDLRSCLPDLDAMLITSRRESFSRVAVEAMLARLPLVAPDIPGLSTTIGNNQFARTYPVGDGTRAAEEVATLFANYASATQLAGQAATWAESKYSPDVVAPQIGAVYRSLA